MNKYSLKIQEYYEDIINQIDVTTENILAITDDDIEKSKINSERNLFCDEISKIMKFNLKNLQILDQNDLDDLNEKEIDSLLFNGKFCFYWNEIRSIGTDNIGTLIITNQYINQNIQNNIKIRFLREKNVPEKALLIREEILISTFVNLFDANYANQAIFDLSNINNLEIFKFKQKMSKGLRLADFKIVETIINPLYVTECNLGLTNVLLNENILSIFPNLKKCRMNFNENGRIGPNCFNALKKLDTITLCKLLNTKINKEIVTGLENVTNLDISESQLADIVDGTFESLTNLKSLRLEQNQIESLKRNYFIHLKNLELLDLGENYFQQIPKDTFIDLKNLLYLNLRDSNLSNVSIDCLNVLQNLEFLSIFNSYSGCNWLRIEHLNLPKLKILSLVSLKVPKFKYLNLRFLNIYVLDGIKEDSFKEHTNLRGITLDTVASQLNAVPDCLKKFKNLSYISIRVDDSNPTIMHRNKNCEKFYSRFLNSNEFYSKVWPKGLRFEVSTYEKTSDFYKKELDVSESIKHVFDNYNYLG